MNFIRDNQKKIAMFLLLFVGAFTVGAAIGKLADNKESLQQKAIDGKNVNILFLGIDARSANENSRSDTMILASIDTKNKKVAMVWIPRDTRIQVSLGHYDKINSVSYTKGPEGACETVSQLLGTDVDYYAVTNFGGFGKIIDILGGVNIDVETNMVHWDPDPALNINLAKGPQFLNGANALRYVRYRGGPTADIGRTERQAKFIKAISQEMFKTSIIFKLPQLIPEIQKNIKTNIPVTDLAYLVTVAKGFNLNNIITQTLPGYGFTDEKTGVSYWEVDRDVVDGILDKMWAGQKFEVAQDPPSWVTTPVKTVEPEVPQQTDQQPSNNDAGTVEPGSDSQAANQDQKTAKPDGNGVDNNTTPPDNTNAGTNNNTNANSTDKSNLSDKPADNTPGANLQNSGGITR